VGHLQTSDFHKFFQFFSLPSQTFLPLSIQQRPLSPFSTLLPFRTQLLSSQSSHRGKEFRKGVLFVARQLALLAAGCEARILLLDILNRSKQGLFTSKQSRQEGKEQSTMAETSGSSASIHTFEMDPDFVVGLIGMGDMGKMYARRLSAAGWR